MPRRKKSKLRQMLDAIEKTLVTSACPNGRNIRENIKNKKRKTRKSKRKKTERPVDF